MTSEPQLAAIAADLVKGVRDLTDSVDALDTRLGRVQRRLTWTIAGVVLLVLIVAGGVVLYIQQQDIVAAQQRQTCVSGNEARAVSVQLWNYVLDFSDRNPAQTSVQKAQVAQFRQYLTTTFAPRDCGK